MSNEFGSVEELAQRLTRLEGQNQRYKKIGVSCILCVLLCAVMGQAPASKHSEDAKNTKQLPAATDSDWIRARTFTVHDADGGLRGHWHSWGGTAGGAAGLTLFAKNGEGQVSLAERWYDNGPTLGLGYHERIRMWAPPTGPGPQLKFRGNNGHERMLVSATNDGSEINLSDSAGRIRLRLRATKSGGFIEFLDASGNVQCRVGP